MYKSAEDDNLVSGITFQSTKNVPYGEHEEFIKSFMEKANLKHYEIGADLPRETIVHNVGGHSHISFLWEFFDGVMISFGTWTNHPELIDVSNFVDTEEIRKIAKKFVAKHQHLYDPEKCSAVKIDVDWIPLHLFMIDGGIPIYEVSSHTCESVLFPGQSRIESIMIDASTGEHACFNSNNLIPN